MAMDTKTEHELAVAFNNADKARLFQLIEEKHLLVNCRASGPTTVFTADGRSFTGTLEQAVKDATK